VVYFGKLNFYHGPQSSVVAVQLRLSQRAFSYLPLVINFVHPTFQLFGSQFCFLFSGRCIEGQLLGKSMGLEVEEVNLLVQ
jgi:hypothetical protein